jgi:polysaccharide export outer membrane protein
MFRDSFPGSSEVFWKRLVVGIVLPLLLAAAVAAQNSTPATEGVAPNAPKPLPGANDPVVAGAQVDLGTYVIGANDILNIEVFGQPLFSKLYSVRPDGILTISLIGDMKAEGLTPLQLKKQLTEALGAGPLKDPEVTVGLYEVRSKKYTVTGQVKRPGSYPLTRTITVFEALTEAGGFLDNFANQKDILIMHGDTRSHFNYKDYLKGKNRDKNIALQNGDTVVVK